MIVYRFEREGVGPYIGGCSRTMATNKKAAKKVKHLTSQIPHDWSKWQRAHNSGVMLFGCPSKKALQAYFGLCFKPLFTDGYRIKKYAVPDHEVVNMGLECAFPVKYHRLRTKKKLDKVVFAIRSRYTD